MIPITTRNVKIFFRDKSAVFFSLLGVLIVIALYVLFLGDTMVQNLKGQPGNVRFLMDSWIMAGTLAIASITTSMGAFGVMVEDRAKKIFKDFSASPLSRRSLAGGYIASSFIIGTIMSLLTLIFAEIYIVASGGALLSPIAFVKMFLCILLSVLSSSSMVYFLISFFSSQNAFSTASAVISSMIGFLTGVYMPIGFLPPAVGFIVKVFPVSHAALLMRYIMMEAPMQQVFQGAPAEVVREFQHSFGLSFSYGGTDASILASILVLVATTLLFYGLTIWNLSRKRKK